MFERIKSLFGSKTTLEQISEEEKPLYSYLYLKKDIGGKINVREPEASVVAAGQVGKVGLKSNTDQEVTQKDRLKKAKEIFNNSDFKKQHKNITTNILGVTKELEKGNWKKAVAYYNKLFKSSTIRTFIEEKKSDYTNLYNSGMGLKYDEDLENKIAVKALEKGLTTASKLPSSATEFAEARYLEKIFIHDAIQICQKLCNDKKLPIGKNIAPFNLSKSNSYVDYIYRSDNKIYRIIVGKKEYVEQEGFGWLDKNELDTEVLQIFESLGLEKQNNKYKLTKIGQGKTEEKYSDTKLNSEKRQFSFRYRIYVGENQNKQDSSNSGTNENKLNHSQCNEAKLAILKHCGYINGKEIGGGMFGTVYLDEKAEKNSVKRVIKVCLGTEKDVKTEWKGVNTANKIFDNIKNLGSDVKSLREQFYKNESVVFNKNKALGQLSEIKNYEKYDNYWYCVSTSEYKTGNSVHLTSKEDKDLIISSNTNLWIELQAFAKNVLNGLKIFHEKGTAQLDIKIENIFRTKLSENSHPVYSYAIADHSTVFNKNDFMNKLAKKYKNNYLDLNGEELKKKIWDDENVYEKEIKPKLAVGTGPCMAPEIPSAQNANRPKNSVQSPLPYEYDPRKADSYSAGIAMWDYAKKLVGGYNLKKSAENLKSYDTGGLYNKFENLINNLKNDDWDKRLSCTKALNHEFITTKIQ